jgi:hypothetical protein
MFSQPALTPRRQHLGRHQYWTLSPQSLPHSSGIIGSGGQFTVRGQILAVSLTPETELWVGTSMD